MVRTILISVLVVITVNFCLCKSIEENLVTPEEFETDEIDLSYLGETIYGVPDERTGEMIKGLNPENLTNPEELGNYAEGDILFPKPATRNGLRDPSKHWPNGVVPFVIEGSFSQQDRQMFSQAMDEFHAKSCIRFKPRGNEVNYIAITNSVTGCWSSVGMIGRRQEVNFQSPGCLYQVGVVIHELLHALGFMHEQNRDDRDNNVQIQWQNVKPGTTANFEKASASTTDAQAVSYDFESVLHYSPKAFSTNNQPTIVSLRGNQPNMGQRKGFSEGDLIKLNRMYNCPANKPTYANSGSNSKPGFFELLFNAFKQPMAPKQ